VKEIDKPKKKLKGSGKVKEKRIIITLNKKRNYIIYQ
jgi:hypothetical protein